MEQVVSIANVDVHVEGTGPDTIVMVHGWPDTYRLWDGQVATLKDRYRCIRFTLPGFDPAHEPRTRTLDELVATLRQVIEQLSPGRPVILLLHDWGCVFGYEFAMRHPQMVSRIVGVDVGDPKSLERSLTLAQRLMVLTYQLILALAWLLPGRAGDVLTRFMARRLGYRLDMAPVGACMNYPYYMMWFGGAHSYRRHLQEFAPACPMLFIYGRRKPMMFHAQAWADELRQRPGSAVVEFDAGHWVMTRDPARFNDVVGTWLAGAVSSRGA
jgi:pimeloyl-ACP methyl ester carboxylesterase